MLDGCGRVAATGTSSSAIGHTVAALTKARRSQCMSRCYTLTAEDSEDAPIRCLLSIPAIPADFGVLSGKTCPQKAQLPGAT